MKTRGQQFLFTSAFFFFSMPAIRHVKAVADAFNCLLAGYASRCLSNMSIKTSKVGKRTSSIRLKGFSAPVMLFHTRYPYTGVSLQCDGNTVFYIDTSAEVT